MGLADVGGWVKNLAENGLPLPTPAGTSATHKRYSVSGTHCATGVAVGFHHEPGDDLDLLSVSTSMEFSFCNTCLQIPCCAYR